MTRTAAIEVGDTIPPFQRVTGLDNWNRYAAVNDEFVPIHMDDEAGRAAGYPTAFGMGNLQWSYLHNLLRGWLGPEDEIVALSCQFRSANTKGTTVTARGVVAGIREVDGLRLAELEIWTEDQDGKQLVPGRATVALGP